MSEGSFGFTRAKIIRFAVIFIASFALLVFCSFRIILKLYHTNEGSHSQIRSYSSALWTLHEITAYAVNTQRSSLNLLIYGGDKKELQNIQHSIHKNRDSLTNQLDILQGQTGLETHLSEQIKIAANNYLLKNDEFCRLAEDSVKKNSAADYNVKTMRPALRKLTDLARETGKSLTGEIQNLTAGGPNLFSMWEFWVLMAVALPYLYFLVRFVHLFIKLLISDRFL